jgi:hypothetical protein
MIFSLVIFYALQFKCEIFFNVRSYPWIEVTYSNKKLAVKHCINKPVGKINENFQVS